MGEGDEDNKLKNATLNGLKLAEKHNLCSIAYPAISTGVFDFPVDRCAEIMIKTTIDFLKSRDMSLKVIFCLYDYEAYDCFEDELEKVK